MKAYSKYGVPRLPHHHIARNSAISCMLSQISLGECSYLCIIAVLPQSKDVVMCKMEFTVLARVSICCQRSQSPVKGSSTFGLPPSLASTFFTERLHDEYGAASWMASAHQCRHLSCDQKSKVVAVNRGSPAADHKGGPATCPELDDVVVQTIMS